ncbi:hypothetical protein AAY473_008293 [Plecturocebus cupreus]
MGQVESITKSSPPPMGQVESVTKSVPPPMGQVESVTKSSPPPMGQVESVTKSVPPPMGQVESVTKSSPPPIVQVESVSEGCFLHRPGGIMKGCLPDGPGRGRLLPGIDKGRMQCGELWVVAEIFIILWNGTWKLPSGVQWPNLGSVQPLFAGFE